MKHGVDLGLISSFLINLLANLCNKDSTVTKTSRQKYIHTFKLQCNSSHSLKLSNISEMSWRWILKDGIQVEKSKTKWLCVYVRHELYCKKFHFVVMKRCIAYGHWGLLRGMGREKTRKRKQTGRDDDAVISCSSKATKESVRPRPLVSGDFPSPFSKKNIRPYVAYLNQFRLSTRKR